MCVVSSISSAELTIKNRLGLHARAAAKLVKAAGEYQADIKLLKGLEEADARSVLSLISLGCPFDTKVVLTAEGVDADMAVVALSSLIQSGFGEE